MRYFILVVFLVGCGPRTSYDACMDWAQAMVESPCFPEGPAMGKILHVCPQYMESDCEAVEYYDCAVREHTCPHVTPEPGSSADCGAIEPMCLAY